MSHTTKRDAEDDVPLHDQIAAVRHYLEICRLAGTPAHNTRAMRAVLNTLLSIKPEGEDHAER
jgi:hypothetical protein